MTTQTITLKSSCKIDSISRMSNGALLLTYTLRRVTRTLGVDEPETITALRGATFAPAWLPTHEAGRSEVALWLLVSLSGFGTADVVLDASEDAIAVVNDTLAELRAEDWRTVCGIAAAYQPSEHGPVRLRVVGIPGTLCALSSALERASEDLVRWGDELGYELVRIASELRDAHKEMIRDRWQELARMYRLMGLEREERHHCESRVMKYTGRLLDTRANSRAWHSVAPAGVKVFGTAPFGRRRAQG